MRTSDSPPTMAANQSAIKLPLSNFAPLDAETRPVVTTKEAAHYLCLAPQTLRVWACRENGLIRPIRIGRRLGWPVADIKRVLGV